VLTLLPWLSVCLLQAGPLDAARESYQSGELEDARSRLEALLYPLQLPEETMEQQAHLLLGASLHALGDVPRAAEEVVRGFGVGGEAPLDPLLFPPDFVAFANMQRSEHKERIDGLIRERSLRKIRDIPAKPIHPAWCFVPFGAGQYQTKQPTKATVLAITQGVLLSTAVTSLVVALSLRQPDGSYRPSAVSSARTLNALYIGSAYTLGVTYVYGVVDALVHRSSMAR
jgi:hypothetical protein